MQSCHRLVQNCPSKLLKNKCTIFILKEISFLYPFSIWSLHTILSKGFISKQSKICISKQVRCPFYKLCSDTEQVRNKPADFIQSS